MIADEFESADEFNRFIEGLLVGDVPLDAQVDPDVARSARHFHRLGALAMPGQEFVSRLEEHLMINTVANGPTQVPALPLFEPSTREGTPAQKGRSIGGQLRLRTVVMAAILAISTISVVALGIDRLGTSGPPAENEIPAPMAAIQSSPEGESIGATCEVSPRTEEQYALQGPAEIEAILEASHFAVSPNNFGRSVPVMSREALPDGEAADSGAIEAIHATVSELLACLNAGDYARADALYSDDSFRRAIGHLSNVEPATPTLEPVDSPVDTPSIVDTAVLPDGRVGVLLSHDVVGHGLQQYMILVETKWGWLVDEQVFVASRDGTEASASGTPGPVDFTIQITDFAYQPAVLTVPADTLVTIRLSHLGLSRQSFVIEDLGIELYLEPNTSTTVELMFPPGKYEFGSDVPGHRAAGLSGTIEAVSSGTPVPD